MPSFQFVEWLPFDSNFAVNRFAVIRFDPFITCELCFPQNFSKFFLKIFPKNRFRIAGVLWNRLVIQRRSNDYVTGETVRFLSGIQFLSSSVASSRLGTCRRVEHVFAVAYPVRQTAFAAWTVLLQTPCEAEEIGAFSVIHFCKWLQTEADYKLVDLRSVSKRCSSPRRGCITSPSSTELDRSFFQNENANRKREKFHLIHAIPPISVSESETFRTTTSHFFLSASNLCAAIDQRELLNKWGP